MTLSSAKNAQLIFELRADPLYEMKNLTHLPTIKRR